MRKKHGKGVALMVWVNCIRWGEDLYSGMKILCDVIWFGYNRTPVQQLGISKHVRRPRTVFKTFLAFCHLSDSSPYCRSV